MYHIAVILTDAQRRVMWVNEDFTKITGYTLTEVIGKKPGEVLQGPGSKPEVIARIRKALDEMVAFKDEILNYRKNGEPYPCKLAIHPIFNDDHQLTNFIAFEVDGNEVQDDHDLSLLQVEQKYQSSSLRGLDEIKLYGRIKELMEQKFLYHDPGLNLLDLARRLDTNTKYLSQVVNRCSGLNFQTFINSYRVKDIKRRLGNGEHHQLTLYGIAQQCGFKNKSTFYKVFKDMTGKTPREYVEAT